MSLLSRLFFLSTPRKYSHCWTFLMTAVMFSDPDRTAEMRVPKYPKVWTLSTLLPLT